MPYNMMITPPVPGMVSPPAPNPQMGVGGQVAPANVRQPIPPRPVVGAPVNPVSPRPRLQVPPPRPIVATPPNQSNQPKREMRTQLTDADKGPVKQLTARAMDILHDPALTDKLKQLLESGTEPSIAVADVLDDILMKIDKGVPGGIPFAQLVLVAVILLSDLNKIVATITGKPLGKDVLKLALKNAIENTVGKDAIQAAAPAGKAGGVVASGPRGTLATITAQGPSGGVAVTKGVMG